MKIRRTLRINLQNFYHKITRRSIAIASVAGVVVVITAAYFVGQVQAANIIPSTTTPAVAVSTDTGAVELGVKFTSDTPGQVTGIRFYKGGTTNNGTHYGHLWTASGTQLAQAKFVSETSSGWQSVNFTTPISITANTTYLASYYAPKGHYSYTSQGLSSAINNGSLHALANSTSPNGVYLYTSTATGGFPASSFNATNYFVDVNFTAGGDTTAPTASITSPANNATISGQTTVSVSASDNVGVSKVELYVDGALNATDTTSPYSFILNTASLSNGSHQLVAKAYDAAGNVGTSSTVNVTVSNTDTTAPTANVTNPTAGQNVSGTISLTANANDNVAVSSVQYFLDGNALGSPLTTSPYTLSWNSTTVSNGSHALVAKATDPSGNVGTSASVPFTVSNADTTAPTVTMTNPTNGQSVSGSVSLTASASDNVAVASVQYYLDGNALGTAQTTSPYALNWDTTTVANGSHVLVVKATDTSGNVGTSNSVNVTVSIADTTAPTISITTPTNNQMVSGTIQLQASASDSVGVASVQYFLDGSSVSIQIPSNPYTYNFDTTSVSNGSHILTAKATDTSGNVGTSAPVTINVQNSTSSLVYSIWSATSVPTHTDSGDAGAVTLGVKFQSLQNGYITGLRFYKGGTTNGGTHTGQLWSSTGTLLAQATFSNESGSGWQSVAFSSGVAITANTTYIASYFAPLGHYAYDAGSDPGGLNNSVINGPLTAPSSSTSGGNDVYNYGSSAVFPTQTYNANNYWVDVFFSTTNTAPDTTAPTASITNPTSGATVSGNVSLTANATDDVAVATVQYYLDGNALGSSQTTSPYTLSWDTTAVSNGSHVLSAKATDTSGNVGTSSSVTVTVQNAGQTRPGIRGSGPILVLTDPTSAFSDDYCNALLKTEGLPECAATDTGNLTSTFDLSPYRVIVMASGSPLTSSQVSIVNNWVTLNGGTFIAMRPNDNLDSLLGIGQSTGTLGDKYYKVDSAQLPGIETQTMQYHGAADQHALAGATAMATLYSDANTATSYPAITTRTVGTGKAIAYMFDVSQSVLLTRNGNPALAGQSTISTDGLARFADRFGNGYLDVSKVSIPQADELQRTLANLVVSATSAPRLWYFPSYNGGTIKAALVLTGDDHATPGSQTISRFAAEQAASPAGCSFTDWTCYTSTSYAFPGAFSDTQAKPYTDAGFEVSMHAADGGSCITNWTTQAQLDSYILTSIQNFQASYPTISAAYPTLTERIHCYGIWKDYASIPKDEASRGIKADANSSCWPNQYFNVAQCLFTGAGMPENYVDTAGNLTGVYQFTTQATDENPTTVSASAVNGLVTNATGPNQYYGYFTLLCHLDGQGISPQCATDALSVAQSNNIPMISARLAELFWDGRNNASISGITYGTNSMSYTVNAPVKNMQIMVPTSYNGKTLSSVTVNGTTATITTQTVNGIQYAFVTVPTNTSNLIANYQ